MDPETAQADRTPEGWSRVAEAYDDVVAPFLAGYAEHVLEATDLREGERVLDVAAGSGALSLMAARRGARVTAVDFSPGMVERLTARASGLDLDVEVAVMDGQALELEDGGFDAAYSNFGVIFFPDRVQGFREMARVLAPGGRAAVTGWSRPERVGFFRAFRTALGEAFPDLPPPEEPPAAFSLADPERFEEEMRAGGFEDVEVHPVTRTWSFPDPVAVWEAMTTTNPVFPSLMARLGDGGRRDLEAALVRQLGERFGDEPVTFEAEALVGIGRR